MKSTHAGLSDVSQDAADFADRARREVKDAGERLADMADRAQSEAMKAGTTISELVVDEIDRRGAALADGLKHIAQTVRDAAKHEGETPRIVEQAVGVIDEISGRLREGSVRDMGDRIARFGRANPGTLAVAALATGVLAGRFLIARGAPRPARGRAIAPRDPMGDARSAGDRLHTEGGYDRP